MERMITRFLVFSLALLPLPAMPSFIETTIGTAVVNDATASYYNPAALVLLKNPQVIPQITFADLHTQFSGKSTTVSTGITQTGRSSSNTEYGSPSLFFGLPTLQRITLGLAIVSNAANRNVDENALLRYVQSKNTIQDYDVVPAFSFKINELLSMGAGINFSHANFDLQPINGFPGSNMVDSQSDNQTSGSGIGGNVGILFKPTAATVIGFNYRSLTTYHLSGKSIYESSPPIVSNHYHFNLWTPARSVFSINHFFTQQWGLIGTVQRIQWSAITNIHVYGIANVSGTTPVIVNGTVPYYLHDSWLLTLGSHYRMTQKSILRIAATYNQSPGNPRYQIANGDSIILGASIGYEINKLLSIDGSYAHAFIQNETINIHGKRFFIQGTNQGSRDAVSVKVTFNIV